MTQNEVTLFPPIIVGSRQSLQKDVKNGLTKKKKITLLLQKLCTEENTKFTNLILPKKPEDIFFWKLLKFCARYLVKETAFFIQDISV